MSSVTISNGHPYLITGPGAEYYFPEEGMFEVRHMGLKTAFKTLVAAFLWYRDLDATAVIWDCQSQSLVESKLLLN